MIRPKIIWDTKKAFSNHNKHGVSFEEAKSVFEDEQASLFFDQKHSDKEDRFLLLGLIRSVISSSALVRQGVSEEPAQRTRKYVSRHRSEQRRITRCERTYDAAYSQKLRPLLVCHCFREEEDCIRIISARKATKKEQKEYKRGML